MRKQGGFTLVEVLITAFVIGIVFVSVGTLFVMSMKVNVSAGDQTECVTLAQQQMERLRGAEYDALAEGGDINAALPDFSQYIDVNGDNSNDYLVAWSIAESGGGTPTISAAAVEYMSLEVQCSALRGANAQSGAPKKVQFTTYKTRAGE